MAFGVTSLGSVGDTAARSDKTCSVFRAPAANALILVGVLVTDTAGTPVEPSFVSGSGLIFSLITSSVTYSTIASALHNLSVWGGMGSASIVSSVITANFSNNNTGCAMQVLEISGVSTSGTSGAKAWDTSATSRADAISRLTTIGPSATSTANAWLLFGSCNSRNTQFVNNNFTVIDHAGYLTPDCTITSAWTTLSSGNSASMATTGSDNRAGIIVQLVLDNPAATAVGPGNYYQYYLRHVVGDAA